MYYIWFDESDKEGAFYSNFYGGILVDSKNYEKVIAMSKTFIEECGITEEIKWQKVNEFCYENYKKLVDFIFNLLSEDLIKIRLLKPGFNIGESTGISKIEERWSLTYSHWSFKPSNYVRNFTKERNRKKTCVSTQVSYKHVAFQYDKGFSCVQR